MNMNQIFFKTPLHNLKRSPGILYISYDGMLEPLGQSQVLAYLEFLALERPIHLISFEKSTDLENIQERKRIEKRINKMGIRWHILLYHKSPSGLATAWDIFRGTVLGWWLTLRYGLYLVHARSYVPSVMAILIKRLTGAKFLFDMRGFWADERVDGGLWKKNSFMFQISKWFERQFFLRADHVVSLTFAAKKIIRSFKYLEKKTPSISVIPTCADLMRFKVNCNLSTNTPFVLGYVGSVGTWYMFEEVAKFFAILLETKPNAQFLIVNRGEHDVIQKNLIVEGVPQESFKIISCAHTEIPQVMAKMTAGIFFIKPTFSKQASAPTKLAEFLGCGIPCVVNDGVGDMSDLLLKYRAGITIGDFSSRSFTNGLIQLLELLNDSELKKRCNLLAKEHFSLENGVNEYSIIYNRLLHLHQNNNLK
jgi:glycosyltransferase involved in cell wall biosynthesis